MADLIIGALGFGTLVALTAYAFANRARFERERRERGEP